MKRSAAAQKISSIINSAAWYSRLKDRKRETIESGERHNEPTTKPVINKNKQKFATDLLSVDVYAFSSYARLLCGVRIFLAFQFASQGPHMSQRKSNVDMNGTAEEKEPRKQHENSIQL